jgi:uncharacterized membrane protein YgcG
MKRFLLYLLSLSSILNVSALSEPTSAGGSPTVAESATPPTAYYPSALNNYVNDYAGLLNEGDSQALQNKLIQLKEKAGIEGTVVIVDSIKSYGGESIEKFATGLFNHWGVGNKNLNNGFMILVAVRDREFRIELGDGYETKHNNQMERIARETLTPHFKSGAYGIGLRRGVLEVSEELTVKSWGGRITEIGLFLVLAYYFLVKRGGWRKILEDSKSGNSGSFGGGRSSGRGGASGRW